MRWLFCEPGSPDEKHKTQVASHIMPWWREFTAKVPQVIASFKQEAKFDLPGWMHETLGKIDPRLMWEYGPAIKGEGHRLVITPEMHRELRPLTSTILKNAPQLPGWEFYPYRLPESLEMAQITVEARTNGSLQGVTFRPAIGEGRRIDLTFFSPRTKNEEDQQSLHDAFVATETLLGEEFLDKWIGSISVAPVPKAGLLGSLFGGAKASAGKQLPLERLRDTVTALSQSVVEQLPPVGFAQRHDDAGWANYQMDPEQAEDYLFREDVIVGSTMEPDLLAAMLPGGGFFSGRFSRVNERFCYVKIDSSEIPIEQRVEARGELEEALHEALMAANSGAQIGGAVGLRYVYIDLALTNVQAGLQIIRKLCHGRVSRRSWAFFCDADYIGEWIGLYSDSPPPPLPNFDE